MFRVFKALSRASIAPRAAAWFIAGTTTAALTGAYVSQMPIALAEEPSSSWKEWKTSILTNYENRIRTFSTPEKVFQVFASVQKDGQNYMTLDDFVRALLPHEAKVTRKEKAEVVSAKANRPYPAAFKVADQNGDGLISFSEYIFFVTLLSIPESHLKVAFNLMDTNYSGTVDKAEFEKLMTFVQNSAPGAKAVTLPLDSKAVSDSWMTHFFGRDLRGVLTKDKFAGFVKQLHADVLRLEFDLYDKQNLGYVSQRDFGKLLVSYADIKHLPAYLDRAKSLSPEVNLGIFSFEQFASVNKLIDHIDEVETAMNLYQRSGVAFRKKDLQHLSKVICKTELNQPVVDTIMAIFDENKDGILNTEEFVNVLKGRKSKNLDAPRDTGFARKLECMWQCASGKQ